MNITVDTPAHVDSPAQGAPVLSAPVLSAPVLSAYVHDPGPERRIGFLEPVLLGRIVSLGLPVIIGMLTQTLINIVDSLFVGRLPEEIAINGQAALGPSLILLWFFGGFLSAISVGTQALTARRFGEGDAKGAGRVLTNSATLAFVSSIVFTVVAMVLVDPIFRAINPNPHVQEVGISFSRIRFLGIFAMVLMASYKSFYDGIGRVHVHMTIAIVMNIVNFVLNYLLVFGKAGMPQLFVDGAAWASVAASSVGFLLMFFWSFRRQDRHVFQVYHWQNLDGGVAYNVARLSIWSGLATMFVMTGFGLFFFIVGHIDPSEAGARINGAATNNIISICMVIFMTCLAFGTSTATLVSQSLGARNPNLASRYGWQSVFVIVGLMTLVGALVIAFPAELLRLFLPADAAQDEQLKAAVISVAVPSLRVCGAIAPVAAAALVLTQALYGAGESRYVMICEAILHFSCLVPLAYFFAIVLHLGLIGCWFATGVYAVALLLATGTKFYGGSWQRIVL